MQVDERYATSGLLCRSYWPRVCGANLGRAMRTGRPARWMAIVSLLRSTPSISTGPTNWRNGRIGRPRMAAIDAIPTASERLAVPVDRK